MNEEFPKLEDNPESDVSRRKDSSSIGATIESNNSPAKSDTFGIKIDQRRAGTAHSQCTAHSSSISFIHSERKKRAHSDSMLYGVKNPACVSERMPRILNDGCFVDVDSNLVDRAAVMPDVLASNDNTSGYNFCTWLSIPSSYKCSQSSEKIPSGEHDFLKLRSHNMGFRIHGRSPGSPKKSPKDYWLLKHNTMHRNDTVLEKREVFLTDDLNKNIQSEHQATRRILSTILDNSPESEELNFPSKTSSLVVPDSKVTSEVQCLKHKKYLQKKYQQQSSSSMESDDVFLESSDVCVASAASLPQTKEGTSDSKTERDSSRPRALPMDTTEEKGSKSGSESQITFTVFTFPPSSRFYRDPCLSESESGLLSPAALSSISSSPGIVSPTGAYEPSNPRTGESLPIVAGLEKFVLGSDSSFSYHGQSCLGESPYDVGNQNNLKDSLGKSNVASQLPPSELHSGSCVRPHCDGIYIAAATSSALAPNEGRHFGSAGDNFVRRVPIAVLKSEDCAQFSHLVRSEEASPKPPTTNLNIFSISGLSSSMLHVVDPKSLLSNKITSSPSSSESSYPHYSAPDLLKDISPTDRNRNHVCQICDRVFSRSDMLSRHMRLHTGQRPYECRTCGQVFSRSDHLQTHLRTHTGEKPYRCSQCSYAAPRRDMVTRHMRVHARGKTKRGKRGIADVGCSSPAAFQNFILVDENYFSRSKPETCHRDALNMNSNLSGKDSAVNKQVLHSMPDQGDRDPACSWSSNVTPHSESEPLQRSPVEIMVCRGSEDKIEYQLPLDLSTQQQQQLFEYHKATQQCSHPHLNTQEYIDWKKLSKAQIEKKNRKWSLAEVSTIGLKNAPVDDGGGQHSSLSSSAACSPVTRSDSAMSVDSGVSYATPSSLIQSVCSPGLISSDSPEVFTPVRGSAVGEPTFFLWPAVNQDRQMQQAVSARTQEHDSIFCP